MQYPSERINARELVCAERNNRGPGDSRIVGLVGVFAADGATPVPACALGQPQRSPPTSLPAASFPPTPPRSVPPCYLTSPSHHGHGRPRPPPRWAGAPPPATVTGAGDTAAPAAAAPFPRATPDAAWAAAAAARWAAGYTAS